MNHGRLLEHLGLINGTSIPFMLWVWDKSSSTAIVGWSPPNNKKPTARYFCSISISRDAIILYLFPLKRSRIFRFAKKPHNDPFRFVVGHNPRLGGVTLGLKVEPKRLDPRDIVPGSLRPTKAVCYKPPPATFGYSVTQGSELPDSLYQLIIALNIFKLTSTSV